MSAVGVVPVLDGGSTGLGGLTLNLDLLGLVCAELAGDVGLLGGSRGLGKRELLDLAFGVGSLNGGRLVGLELAEVEVLDEIGCDGRINERQFGGYVEWCGRSSTLANSSGSDKGAAEGGGRLLLSKTDERLALRRESADEGLGCAKTWTWTAAYRGPERLTEHGD